MLSPEGGGKKDAVPPREYTQWEQTTRFADAAYAREVVGLHTFVHEDVFEAVYTANLLMRVSELLLTKASELAF